ncbi:uncharacterized protein UBRO_06654 [Ustilago bromivora]|uniref:DRBM domain-containing protein n=1 Tax=Ustilago bromivora TaxID=307758 RepID=A0A1K0G7J7_9BASI|nr:uncharacterized protein UBRO_06654 [Ustilago bromivora]
MTHTEKYKATSGKLLVMGTIFIPNYVKKAFPSVSPNNSNSAVPFEFSIAALGLIVRDTTSAVGTSFVDGQEDNVDEEMSLNVPFYVKVRGKGKGRPVLYDPLKSSVAQIYELAEQVGLPEPNFTTSSSGAAHLRSFKAEVSFNNLTATTSGCAGSMKEVKEQACKLLVELILARNKDAGLTA